ncbi:MAG: TonB-dependent receptor [Hyphomonadaceae bacterium]|nr:TonB-dependent receptor [Hyphomonadaceae bacterium]
MALISNNSARIRFGDALRLTTASLLATAGFAGAAFAQQTTQGELPDIVVTAEFREARVQDTPIAITALTGELLEERGIATVTELAAPNVNIAPGAGIFGPLAAVYIRGVGQYDSSFAYEPGVGVYVDDVYYGVLLGSDFELASLDRVEVLRGPQGTNSGRNSIGGSVKLYSQRPTGSNEGYLEASVGSFDRLDFRGSYDLSLVEDKLFLNVSGVSRRRDGHVSRVDFACANPSLAGTIPNTSTPGNCELGREGSEDVQALRATLRWIASDNVEINIRADKSETDNTGPGMTLYWADAPANTYGGVPYDSRFIPTNPYVSYATYYDPGTDWSLQSMNRVSAWGVSGDLSWRLGESLTLRSITAYREMESGFTFDQDMSPIMVSQSYNGNEYQQFTQELRLSGAAGDWLDWTVGGYYFDSEGKLLNRVKSGTVLNFNTNDPVTSTSQSAFVQAILHPAPDFNITGGVRYTEDEKTYAFSRLDPITGAPAIIVGSLTGTSGSFSGDRVDYRLAADYRFSENFMAYAQVATGYKGGGINPKPFIPDQVVPFDPETVTAYEIGFKSDLLDRTLRLNVAAFFNDYKDIILIDANGAQGFFLSAEPINAGDAEVKGVEVEAEWHPTSALTLTTSVGYLDFEYTRLSADALGSGIAFGDVPPLTPEWKASGSIAYEFDLGANGSLTPRLDVQYTSEVYSDPANHGTDALVGFPFFLIDEYTLTNARLTYDSEDGLWQASVGVSNLTDEVYYTNGFAFFFSGTGMNVIGRPREYEFTLRRKF